MSNAPPYAPSRPFKGGFSPVTPAALVSTHFVAHHRERFRPFAKAVRARAGFATRSVPSFGGDGPLGRDAAEEQRAPPKLVESDRADLLGAAELHRQPAEPRKSNPGSSTHVRRRPARDWRRARTGPRRTRTPSTLKTVRWITSPLIELRTVSIPRRRRTSAGKSAGRYHRRPVSCLISQLP